MNLCICGGGNLGHVIAAYAANRGCNVQLLTSHPERWSHDITIDTPDGKVITGHISRISNRPEDVIPLSDIILLCLPGYAIADCLKSIAPLLSPPLGGSPDAQIASPNGGRMEGAVTPIETLLIRMVVRHGEEIIFENLETEDGGTTNLTVAQYIDYDLSQDGLQLSDERYQRILAEAVEHSNEPDFKAEAYFVRHPDPKISQLAADLAMSRYQLSASMSVPQREGSLVRQVTHLVLDYRMNVVEQQLKQLQLQLREAVADMEKVRVLMTQLKQTQELRNALAKQLGNDVIS